MVRYEEVVKGTIDHAIRFTLSKSKVMRGYTSPANHLVSGTNSNEATPTPMGMRLRLKSGSDFYITGAPDERWDNDDLNQLKNVRATDFEVVQMGDIIRN